LVPLFFYESCRDTHAALAARDMFSFIRDRMRKEDLSEGEIVYEESE
jgi:hypothetical protein